MHPLEGKYTPTLKHMFAHIGQWGDNGNFHPQPSLKAGGSLWTAITCIEQVYTGFISLEPVHTGFPMMGEHS